MAVNLQAPQTLLPIAGIELATAAAGIRYQGREDVLLARFDPGTQVAAVFTRNAFCAAPVTLARWHLQRESQSRALLINAGNANAGTGEAGLKTAEACCELVAEHLGVAREAVIPMSTGVIGEALPFAPFAQAMPNLVAGLSPDHWQNAARCIMTTDTLPKGFSREFQLAGQSVRITGISKGAGMIRPDMATMLAFVATDAQIDSVCLSKALNAAVAESFNAITVDGDTSTNDACLLAATGQAGNPEIQADTAEYEVFVGELTAVCQELAQACVRDAEGATRFITVEVSGASSREEAAQVAYTVAHSPLVKTAAFAGDPNWGRILAAVGRSGVAELDVSKIDLYLDEVCLLQAGEPAPDYTEARGAAVAEQAEFSIRIALGRGGAQARVWTCDFSYDYVKINAEYRS